MTTIRLLVHGQYEIPTQYLTVTGLAI